MKTTTFSFNKIYFIESINSNIEEDKDLAIGKPLMDVLQKQIDSLKQKDNKYQDLSGELIEINGLNEWNEAFGKIEQECKNGTFPIIHFICHGYYKKETNSSFMWLADTNKPTFGYIPLQWSDVTYTLERINIACHNNLMVTMCVCYGFYALKNIFDQQHRIPYWCLLSKPNPVSLDEGINMIYFYISLIQNHSLNDALEKLHEVSYNDTTEETEKLKFVFADYWYTWLIHKELTRREDIKCLEEIARNVYQGDILLQYMYKWEDFLQLYIKIYKEDIRRIYEDLVYKKFMFDLYPEERERFDIPKTYEELMKD